MARLPKGISMSKKELGERLRSLRERRGFSQYRLAEMLGTDQSNISHVECGKRSITLPQVVKLSRALGVSTDEILVGAKRERERASEFLRDRRFVRRLQQIHQLSKREKQALLMTIDAFLKSSGGESAPYHG